MKKVILLFFVVWFNMVAVAQNSDLPSILSFGGSYVVLSDKQNDYGYAGLTVKSVYDNKTFVSTNLFFKLKDNSPYKFIFEGTIGKYSNSSSLFSKNGIKSRSMGSLNFGILGPNEKTINNENYLIYSIGGSLGLEFSYKFVVLDLNIGPQWDTENNLYSKFSTSLKFTLGENWIQ